MASQYVELPPTGGGVTSLNTLTGALTLIAGTNISITPGAGSLTIATTGTSFPLLAPNGSLAAPSYSFSTDTNSGMTLLGADNLAIITGGVTAIDIDSSGNLVVGKATTANSLLTIISTAAGASYVRRAGTAGTMYLTSGTVETTGGAIGLYGNTHATLAGVIEFYGLAGSITANFDASGHLNLLAQRELRLQDTTGGQYVALRASGTQTTYTITLPSSAPVLNMFLKYNGTDYVWGSIFTVSSIAANTSGVNGTTYLCDTSGGAFNVTLPTPESGAYVVVKDSTGSFNTNNLTIVRSGSEKIEGIAASRILTSNWSSVTLVSNGTDWFMF